MAPCSPNGRMLAQPDPRPSVVSSAAELNQSDGEVLSSLLPYGISRNRQPETSEVATLPKWTIGWWTPLLLVGFYCFALITAILHYVFFRYLDGKPSNGDLSVLSQSWVITISTLFATVFKSGLLASLAIACTQYLWYTARNTTLKVVTLDALFSIRSNPMVLAQPSVFRAAPVMFIIAVLCKVVTVASIYPPGALTVISWPIVNTTSAQVGTFNSSISYLSRGIISPRLAESQFLSSAGHYISPVASLYRIAQKTLLSGDILPSSMLCGSNCTYTMQFDGPDINCSKVTSSNISTSFPKEAYVYGRMGPNFIYSGQEKQLATDQSVTDLIIDESIWTKSRYEISTSRIVGFWSPNPSEKQIPTFNTEFIWESHNMTCWPSWATYNTTMSWKDGARRISYEKQPNGDLVNLQNIFNWEAVHSKWNRSEYSALWLRDSNLQAIYQTLTDSLAGNFSSLVGPDGTPLNEKFTLSNGTDVSLGQAVVLFQVRDKTYGANATIIANTRFNENGSVFFFAGEDYGPKLSITKELLQEALFNITLSAIFSADLGSQTTTVTATVFRNVYFFSGKSQFFIPYFGTLVITLPFLILGLLALRWNGVSAAEGFIQILTTTMGSKALEKASAGGCLGGEENVPKELKELKVRFGELISITEDKERGIRRAGFGIVDEVVPLKKGGLMELSRK